MQYPMRRKDRQVTGESEIDAILSRCDCCRIAFSAPDGPYIVPMNFGFAQENGVRRLYFHCAGEGRKLALLRQDPRVGFEMDTGHELVVGERACGYSYRYQSIIGTGTLAVLQRPEEKAAAMRRIMAHYTVSTAWEFPTAMLDKTTLLCLTVTELTCKVHE